MQIWHANRSAVLFASFVGLELLLISIDYLVELAAPILFCFAIPEMEADFRCAAMRIDTLSMD